MKQFPVPRLVLLISVAALAGCGSRPKPPWLEGATRGPNKWGYYSGAPETRWDSDGRSMTLLSELRYTDPDGQVWIAPPGAVVDGASIPRSCWSFMGGPFEGRYRNASVLHDVAYEDKKRPWQDCDRMFYNAMRCSGVGVVEAKTMFYALYKFGHHWDVPIKKARRVKPSDLAAANGSGEETTQYPRALPVSREDLDATRDWIRSAEPSLEDIERRAGGQSR
jgi:hypothetical protein